MAYSDVSHYRNKFNGEFAGTDEELNKILELASLKIDELTLNKILKKGFDNLTYYQQGLIKLACCYQADYINANGVEGQNNGLKGYSILDIKVDMDNNTPRSKAQKAFSSVMAYMLLEQTGLPCRVV